MISIIAYTNNSIWYLSIACTQLIFFKYSKWLNSSNLPFDRTLTGPSTPGKSGLGSNYNEGYSIFPKVPGMEPHHQML